MAISQSLGYCIPVMLILQEMNINVVKTHTNSPKVNCEAFANNSGVLKLTHMPK